MLPVKNYVSVQVNGEEIAKGLLGEVEVVQRLNDHWYCKVCYRSPLDDRPEIEKLQRAPVRISLIRLDGSEDVVFAGMVIDAQLQYETTGSYTVEVKAASPDWDMSRSKQKRYFLKNSPQDIASELAGMYGIALAGNVDGDSNLSRVQWDESDYAFLLRLVDDNEAWLRPAEDGLETQTAFQQGVTLEWREGEHGLLEFATKGQLQSLSSCGTQYDPDKMASQTFKDVISQASFYSDSSADMVSRAASLKLLPAELVERCRVATIDDYEQRLKREARRGAVHAVVCRGISRDPQVKAGNEITVAGLSGSQGTYGVVQAIHRWTAKGYENEFVATPAKRWFQAEAAVAPNIRGVFPARVVENYDPHNQGRIQVQYWWQEDSSTTWARLMMPHAGADRGMLFFPEKGDQVMISFEDGDPERPVVVGSSYNGVHRPASEGYWNPGEKNGSEFAKNNIKRIVTKSGHRITLSDEQGRESINFATPRSTRLVMTEKANETGRPALAMHSAGDILLSAPNGRVHVKSQLSSHEIGGGSVSIVSVPPAVADPLKAGNGAGKKKVQVPPGPCTGKGLSSPANEKEFAGDVKKLQKDWPKLSVAERKTRMEEAVNRQLEKSGVPPVEVNSNSSLSQDRYGQMDFQRWRLDVNSAITNYPILSNAQTQQLGDTLYHEARHGEQWYLIARKEAAEGKSADDITTATGMPDQVTGAAVAHPVDSQDPMNSCSQKMYDSVYGSGSSHRNNTLISLRDRGEGLDRANENLRRVQANPSTTPREEQRAIDEDQAAYRRYLEEYRQYKNLPEEADAWQVGDSVGKLLAH